MVHDQNKQQVEDIENPYTLLFSASNKVKFNSPPKEQTKHKISNRIFNYRILNNTRKKNI